MKSELKPVIIAIDGTAASGKGTLAKKLAKHFNLAHLDTGKIYRAVAYNVIKQSIDSNDIYAIEKVVVELDLNDFNRSELTSNEVGNMASIVSKIPQVRNALLEYQRNFPQISVDAGFGGAVVDGRDIGSVIFPNADKKFFVYADVKIRAKRRHEELLSKNESIDYSTVLADISKRDDADKNRIISSLVRCDDSIDIDTTDVDIHTMMEIALKEFA